MPGLFVIGTEPGIGKTTVAAALIAALNSRGRRVAVMKPIETGCEVLPSSPADGSTPAASAAAGGAPLDQESLDSLARLAQLAGPPPASVLADVSRELLRPTDAHLLMEAAGFDFDLDQVSPYRFGPALEPGVAARLAGTEIQVEHILHCQEAVAAAAEVMIVEGSAGLFDPLSPGLLTIDLISRMKLPVLLISGFSPGSISSCIMHIEALRRRDLQLTGLILNRREARSLPEHAANPFQVESYCGELVLGVFPFFTPDQLSDVNFLGERLAVHTDLSPLLDTLQA